MRIVQLTKHIIVYSILIYRKNFVESNNSITGPDSPVPIILESERSLIVPPYDSRAQDSSADGITNNSERLIRCLLNSADLHSEEHNLEFTGGAHCIEIRCYGEVVWTAESENQGTSLRLRRNGDKVDIEDRGTGQLKQIVLGNELHLDLFALGSKKLIDKSQYDFKELSNTEGIFTFKKGVRCNEVRGNGLLVWKARKGDRLARAVSYCGTRQLHINFSDDVHVYNRKDCKWVKEGETVEAEIQLPHPEAEPLTIQKQDTRSPEEPLREDSKPPLVSESRQTVPQTGHPVVKTHSDSKETTETFTPTAKLTTPPTPISNPITDDLDVGTVDTSGYGMGWDLHSLSSDSSQMESRSETQSSETTPESQSPISSQDSKTQESDNSVEVISEHSSASTTTLKVNEDLNTSSSSATVETGVDLDINSKSSTVEYDYNDHSKMPTFKAKTNHCFKLIKEGSNTIWAATDSSNYSSEVEVDLVDDNGKAFTIKLPNDATKVFVKNTKSDPWTEIDTSIYNPKSVNINYPYDSYFYRNNSSNNVRTFTSRTGFAFNSVREDNTDIWTTNDETEFANKVEYAKRPSGQFDVTVYLLNGQLRLSIKGAANKPWEPIDLNKVNLRSINIKYHYHSYFYDNVLDGDVRTFNAKIGFAFNVVNEYIGNYRIEIWKTDQENEYAKSVIVKGDKVTINTGDGSNAKTNVFVKGTDGNWTPDNTNQSHSPNKGNPNADATSTSSLDQHKQFPLMADGVPVTINNHNNTSADLSSTSTESNLEIFVKDPQDPSKIKQLHPSNLGSSDGNDHSGLQKCEFNNGDECVEVKYGDESVWKHESNSTTYPKSVYHHELAKIVFVNFDGTTHFYRRDSSAKKWVTIQFKTDKQIDKSHIKLFTKKHNDTTLTPLDVSNYSVNDLGFGFEYIFNEGVKCYELQYSDGCRYRYNTTDYSGTYPSSIIVLNNTACQVISKLVSFYYTPN